MSVFSTRTVDTGTVSLKYQLLCGEKSFWHLTFLVKRRKRPNMHQISNIFIPFNSTPCKDHLFYSMKKSKQKCFHIEDFRIWYKNGNKTIVIDVSRETAHVCIFPDYECSRTVPVKKELFISPPCRNHIGHKPPK